MIARGKEIFRNYEPKRAAVRLGIVTVVGFVFGIMGLILDGDMSEGLEFAWLVGAVIYGVKIFRNMGGEYRPNYHRGYWSDGSAEADMFGAVLFVCLKIWIAGICGTFLMAVEFIQTIIYCVKKIKDKNNEQVS